MQLKPHKIGATFYILWGIMHIAMGVMLLVKLHSENITGYLSMMGTSVNEQQATMPEIVRGIFGQNAWNLIWFGMFAVYVAIKFNWKNNRMGYWCNLAVVSLSDIGFVMMILIPGYMRTAEAFLGPLLWGLAVFFSTWGIFAERQADNIK